jgi:hypothetical protein
MQPGISTNGTSAANLAVFYDPQASTMSRR